MNDYSVGCTDGAPALDTLLDIQQRVLWLAVRMIDHANNGRPKGEVKVGGHQASSASMVGIMTALWFGHLDARDKVAVKPHASPVLHAVNYLLGTLDRPYLERLRSFGGLQAYPSRTKDPDVVDFSTGSVGLGVVAPLFAAAAGRYITAHFGSELTQPPRYIALAGDAELDEGNVWEAISDPALQGLGNVMWVIDTNRQSLDRVIPDQKIKKLMQFFDAAGWHVIEAKYGSKLLAAYSRDGGKVLRSYIDNMSNEQYQSLFGVPAEDLRKRFLSGASDFIVRFVDSYSDHELEMLVRDLGGHDLGLLIDSFRQCDEVRDRPSVVFAYTTKGWGLPFAGDPLNHSALLTSAHIDNLRRSLGLTPADEWDRFAPESAAGQLCGEVARRLAAPPSTSGESTEIPIAVMPGAPGSKAVSSQDTFGRLLVRLADYPEVRQRLVTVSPDVSISTNLGGWINRAGVFHPQHQEDFLGDGRLLTWNQSPAGHHVELGISEMNLFLMLQALGLGHDLHGQHLLPIGTVYDPFICRGLDALIYALYSGARFIVAGTPAGITLSPEGGAHQSSITPSIGLELPGLTYAEPCFAATVDWMLCDGLARLGRSEGGSLYLRLSTRPIDQGPFQEVRTRIDESRLRADVVAGGYRLWESQDQAPEVVFATCGPVVPEVLLAARHLEAEGLSSLVLDLTSPDRLYREWRGALQAASRHARTAPPTYHLARLLRPHERSLPIVTVHDGASHNLAWLGSVFGTRTLPVGVDEFGQSGTIEDLYKCFDMLPQQLVNAALVVTS